MTLALVMSTVVADPNDPQFVGDINVSQDIARRVTITYTLDEPAIESRRGQSPLVGIFGMIPSVFL